MLIFYELLMHTSCIFVFVIVILQLVLFFLTVWPSGKAAGCLVAPRLYQNISPHARLLWWLVFGIFHKHEIFDFCSEIIFIIHFLLIFGVNTFKLMKSHLMTHQQTLRNIHRHLWGSLLQIYSMSQLNSEWLTSFTTMFTLYLYWKINCTFVLNLVNAFMRYSHWKFLLKKFAYLRG